MRRVSIEIVCDSAVVGLRIFFGFRSGLNSANAHSSIVEQLISKAEWFFPGGLTSVYLPTF